MISTGKPTAQITALQQAANLRNEHNHEVNLTIEAKTAHAQLLEAQRAIFKQLGLFSLTTEE